MFPRIHNRFNLIQHTLVYPIELCRSRDVITFSSVFLRRADHEHPVGGFAHLSREEMRRISGRFFLALTIILVFGGLDSFMGRGLINLLPIYPSSDGVDIF